MSLEFEYLHRKSLCEMLIGGDDISNDVITLGMCFSMFVETFTLKEAFFFLVIILLIIPTFCLDDVLI